ncbi:unnamed protein product [Menidia menidia]|uniref:(Atlantic silverside) hypothetical protein n=1 Tax=Menidia menidia TaxID=238744 RepID=A0A8S4ANT6_9TELE|nr:unnamed protein product [Menidia menidia]
MEAWVIEDKTCLKSDTWLETKVEELPTSSSDMGANPRSESVDSGVETASCDALSPATPCSVSTNNTEMDLFNDRLSPGLTSQSPVLSCSVASSASSSSPRLGPSQSEEGSTGLHLKLEKALQRADSKLSHRVDEQQSRRPKATLLPGQPTSGSVRCQRSESFGLRRRAEPSVPIRYSSEKHRRPLSVGYNQQRSQGLGIEDRKELSPGLCYLEQVCQMLEDIAQKQMHHQASQEERETLEQRQDTQALEICQSDSRGVDKDPSTCNGLENTKNTGSISNQPQQQKSGHFRQRSVSDTTVATLHLRKLNVNCRGQQLSTHDLLERVEEHKQSQDSAKPESKKTNKSWKSKIGSLRRGETALLDTQSQQMQSSDKNSARRRLSLLFRRSRKTQPI